MRKIKVKGKLINKPPMLAGGGMATPLPYGFAEGILPALNAAAMNEQEQTDDQNQN